MTSILDLSSQESRVELLNGTQTPLKIEAGSKRYHLGTDYECPLSPPYSYTHAVNISDFDINKVNLSIKNKTDSVKKFDQKNSSIVYSYEYEDGKFSPFNLLINRKLTSEYGIQAPLSKYLNNWPKNLDPGHNYFDKALDMGSQNPGTYNVTIDLTVLHDLKNIFDQVKEKTASFIKKNIDTFDGVLDKKVRDQFVKDKSLENFMVNKMSNMYTEKSDKLIKYLDIFTVYNSDENSKDDIKMNIKTHFFTMDKKGNMHHIHPSMCIRNKIIYSPVICFNRAIFTPQKQFTIKTLINEMLIFDIQRYSGASSTPKEVLSQAAKMFMTSNDSEDDAPEDPPTHTPKRSGRGSSAAAQSSSDSDNSSVPSDSD